MIIANLFTSHNIDLEITQSKIAPSKSDKSDFSKSLIINMKKNKIILMILISVFILSGIIFLILKFFIFYKNILEPSYASYVFNCKPDSEIQQKLEERGYKTKASTVLSIDQETNKTDITVSFFVNQTKEQRMSTSKHEQCHLVQIYQNRIAYCSQPIRHYLNEVECNLAEDYSDEKYEKRYGEFIDFS